MRNGPRPRALLAVAAILWLPVVASAQSPLALDEAIAIALASNRTLQNAGLEIDKAEREVESARTRRYPTFEVEAQAGQLLTPVNIRFPEGAFGTFPGTGPVPAEDTTLSTPRRMTMYLSARASQPLSQLFKIGLSVRLSESNVELERQRVRSTRLTVVHSVRQQYYELLRTTGDLEAAEHSIALFDQLDHEVSQRVMQRVALKAEGLDVGMRLARAELTRVTLRHALDSQKEQLNQLLGRDLRTPFDVALVAAPGSVPPDLTAAHARALDGRPDITQARVRVQQAELARRMARADLLPDVGVGFSYLSPFNIDGAPTNIASVALQLTWEPFDWGRKQRTIAARGLEIKEAQNAVIDAEQQALGEVNAEFRRMEDAQARLRVARLAQESARENARVRVTQYRAQATLLSEVLQAEAALADTDNQYRQALLSYWTASAGFDRAVGDAVAEAAAPRKEFRQ